MSVLNTIKRLLEDAEPGLFSELFPDYMLDYFENIHDHALIIEINGYFGCRCDTTSIESWLEDFQHRFIPCLFHD